MILNNGDLGENVGLLQRRLNRAGHKVEVTNLFDDATEAAVKSLQAASGLVVDGIAGPKTQRVLAGQPSDKHLSDANLVRAAEMLEVPVAVIRAVNEVESRGCGFQDDGRPVILFERHQFWKQLLAHDIDPAPLAANNPKLLAQTPGGYQGGAAEYVRLSSAKLIHKNAAIESASWGSFQIMGYHWKALGYHSAEQFVEYMSRNEAEQLLAFVHFIAIDSALHAALKAKKWAVFAKLYNGPNYAKNLYDVKLAQAYAKYADADKAAA